MRDGVRAAARGEAHLLISHTHWDHIQGLPFFAPLYQQGQPPQRLRPPARRPHLRAVFASQTDDPYFPVPFDEAQARGDLPRAGRRRALRDRRRPTSRCTRLNHP